MNVWGIASLTVFFAVIATLSLLVIARRPTPPHLQNARTRKAVPWLLCTGFACMWAFLLFYFGTLAHAPRMPNSATGEVHRVRQKSRVYYVTEDQRRLMRLGGIGAFSILAVGVGLARLYHPRPKER